MFLCCGFGLEVNADQRPVDGVGKQSASSISPIKTAFERFSAHQDLKHALVAFSVYDAKNSTLVFEHNGNVGMAPASTLKTLIAIEALVELGSEYRYQTTLSYVGQVDEDGILHGDLVVKGNGDPTLGSDRYEYTKPEIVLDKFAESVQKAGIREIQGRIIADDLAFDGYRTPGGWPWQDMGNYYGAGVSSINWRENSFHVDFQATVPGKPAGIRAVYGLATGEALINEVETGPKGSGDQVYGYSAPYAKQILIQGSYGLDLKKSIRFSHPNPAQQLLVELKNSLKSKGITQEGDLITAYELRNKDANWMAKSVHSTQLIAHESPTVAEIIYHFNQKSVNLFGESLLSSIAYKRAKENGVSRLRVDQRAAYLGRRWVQELNIPGGATRIYDGSGLSPENRVTTQAMSLILLFARDEPWFPEFYKSLPNINGMAMKSGTIKAVLGYTGYHKSKDGEEYVFSILVANYEGRAPQMRRRMFELLNSLK